MSMLPEFWNNLSPTLREAIVGGTVSTLIATVIVAAFKLPGYIVHRLSERRQKQIPPTPLTPHELTIKVEGAQPIATIQTPQPAPPEPPPPQPLPSVPRPPVVGFVARRDTEGRDILEQLKEELAPEKSQLVALWGKGGVGKTTLAAEAARALKERFKGCIAWISAEGRTEFTLSTLLDEIAAYLGRTDLRPLVLEAKKEQVRALLANKPCILIVLDNFETVAPAEQEACAEWIAHQASCPALITSRDEVPHARPLNILAMTEEEAREFLQKLIRQARNPRAFEGLDHESIIGASDRIPLVLQWVIKQIDSARQPQVALNELMQGKGDAAQRVFDRSFNLPQVGDDGRDTLLALSLFAPSATPEALAEVAGFGQDLECLQRAVAQLIELWLIEATPGNQRFSVEGLTRELTRAHFNRDPRRDDFNRRFVACFLRYAVSYDQPTPEDYDVLEAELGNLLDAMDVAFRLKEWGSVHSIAYTLALPRSGMLSVRGYWNEAIECCKKALLAAKESNSEWYIGAFTNALGTIFANRGEFSTARKYYEIAVDVAKRLNIEQGLAATLNQLGTIEQNQGNLEEARQLYNESLEIKKKLGNQSGIAITLHQLAMLTQKQGNLEGARQLYDESLEIKKKLGDQSGIAITLHQLGRLAQDEGKLEEARQLYDESLEIKKKLGDQRGIALTLGQFGVLAEEMGDKSEAARLYREALSIFERLGTPDAEIARQDLERVKGKSS